MEKQSRKRSGELLDEDCPALKKQEVWSCGATRMDIGTALFSGLHRRSGAESLLSKIGMSPFLLRDIFDRAVPPIDSDGRRYLQMTAYGMVIDSIELPLDKFSARYRPGRADLVRGGRCGNTVAHATAEFGKVDTLRYVCKRDPSLVRLRNEGGNEPIHVATELSQRKCISVLVEEFGANINALSINRGTPLDIAISNRNPSMAEFILSLGGCKLR